VRFREVGAICGEHSGGMPTRPAAMTTTAPIADVVAHRAYLVRFAMRRLRDPMLAEDAVHDVFEAVLSGRATFAGRAALRSWLTAVLKHKIVDAMRRSPLHESLDETDEADGPGHDVAAPCPAPRKSSSSASCSNGPWPASRRCRPACATRSACA
jgi:RNA polymerase sigma-70 factor (ECF subfamily)